LCEFVGEIDYHVYESIQVMGTSPSPNPNLDPNRIISYRQCLEASMWSNPRHRQGGGAYLLSDLYNGSYFRE